MSEKEMIFTCDCVKCGTKESTGIAHYPDGRQLCKKCYEEYDHFLLDLFLTKGGKCKE